MSNATVTFENSDKTKKAVFTFHDDGDEFKIDCEFIPELNVKEEKSVELYAHLAFTFLQSMKAEL